MSETDVAIRYIFVLSFILIIVAYYIGSTQVLSTGASAATGLINAVTGRTSSGGFSSYPTNG